MPPKPLWRNLREEVRDNHKLLLNKSIWSKVRASIGCPWTDLLISIPWNRLLATDGKTALLVCMAWLSAKSSSHSMPCKIDNDLSVRVTLTHSILWMRSCKSTESNRCCSIGRRWVNRKSVTSTRIHHLSDLINICTDPALIFRLRTPCRNKQV